MRSSETCTIHRMDFGDQQISSCNTKKTTNNPQPWWWCGGGHGGAASADMPKEDKRSWPSPKCLDNSTGSAGPKTSIASQSRIQLNETSESNIKEIQITLSPHTGGKSATPHEGSMQSSAASIMLPMMNSECYAPASQSELVAHSITCTSYHDAYYGGVMPPLGLQALVHSQYSTGGILHPGRMALPLQMAEEPVYVNAKQYHGILRRRQSRAKAEVEKKMIRARKPYLHESRHLHAMRRERGCGGRFVSKKKVETASNDEKASNNVTSASVSLSSESASSKLSFININGTADSYQTNHHRQVAAEPSDANSSISCYQTHQGSLLHLSAYI